MTRLRPYGLPLFLAGCALLTAGLLLWPVQAAAPVTVRSVPRYDGQDFVQRPASRLTAFALTLGAVETTTPAPAAETPVLVGVAGSAAYLRSRSSGQTQRVAVGEELDGWKVVGVRARTVTLRGPSGDRRLDLFPVEAEPPAQPAPVQTDQPGPNGP